MKTSKWCIAGALAATMFAGQAAGQTPDIETVNQNMLDACPATWEDITSEIDPSTVTGDIWNGDTADKDAFKTFLSTEMGANAPTGSELDTMASDVSTVAAECATQRIALLDGLLSRLPKDVLLAMNSVLDHLGLAALAIEGGGWQVGDVRITGRPEPAPGWLFSHGQTIGAPGSDAQLTGDVLSDLYELAKTWFPNSGNEDWAAGDIVILPQNVQPSVNFNGELKFADGGDGDLVVNTLADGTLGSQQSTVAASCKAIKSAQPGALSGLYWLDVNGGATSDAFQAYCDMDTDGGGWTLVVAQFEQDPVTNWNEGIQADYDPTLASAKGFALNASQLPLHTEVAFGKDLQPTYVDYVDFVYSTGLIPKTIVTGKKTGQNYHIVRYDGAVGVKYCDPDRGDSGAEWGNSLVFDVVGEQSWAWCVVPSDQNITGDHPDRIGAGMLGNVRDTNETYAWTVWVR